MSSEYGVNLYGSWPQNMIDVSSFTHIMWDPCLIISLNFIDTTWKYLTPLENTSPLNM